MAVLIDPPRWPAHGRLWSHLASDTSLDELHAFAGLTGIPRRAFEGDHYDVPAERYRQAVAAGAQEVEGRDLLRRLVAAGLRVPKRRGEKVVTSHRAPGGGLPGPPGPHAVDVVASALGAPDDGVVEAWVLVTCALRGPESGVGVLLVRGPVGWDLPGGQRIDGEPVEETVRTSLTSAGVDGGGGRPEPAGYVRVRLLEPPDEGPPAPWTYRALFRLHLNGAPDDAAASGEVKWWTAGDAVDALGDRPLGPLVRYVVGARANSTAQAREEAR
jgi:hypothetical protein